MKFRALLLLFLFVAFARGASPHREPTTFSYTSDVGFGKSVFVAGSHLDVGAWDLTKAIKLRWTPGNLWIGQVAIQAGTEWQYRFVARETANRSLVRFRERQLPDRSPNEKHSGTTRRALPRENDLLP